MEKISDKIYVATEYLGNNVGFILTQEGLVLIESPMLTHEAKHWQDQIREITDKPFLYLIVTHHHFDHVIGNGHFACPIIAHKNALRGIEYLSNNIREGFEIFFQENQERWEADLLNLKIVSPQITFSQELFLHLGDTTIELRFVGGHTSSSITVYIPSEKIIFTGDNVTNGIHTYMGQARLNIWTESLRALLDMEVNVIVPGHGPLGNKDIAQKFLDYLELLRERVKYLKTAGYSPEEMVSNMDQIIDFFPIAPGGRSNACKLIAGGIKTIYDQV